MAKIPSATLLPIGRFAAVISAYDWIDGKNVYIPVLIRHHTDGSLSLVRYRRPIKFLHADARLPSLDRAMFSAKRMVERIELTNKGRPTKPITPLQLVPAKPPASPPSQPRRRHRTPARAVPPNPAR